VAETILKAVLDAVAAAFIEKASADESMLASEGCADKAVSTGDEHAPAGDHTATEAAATKSTVEATAAKPAVHATAALCHGWRCHDACRRHRGRGKATEQFGLHDTDPS
jgi:hypothetical protein